VAVAAGHQHHFPGADEAGHDLLDPRVLGPGHRLEALEQLHLGDVVERIVGLPAPYRASGGFLTASILWVLRRPAAAIARVASAASLRAFRLMSSE
jgi:hypothetical protein